MKQAAICPSEQGTRRHCAVMEGSVALTIRSPSIWPQSFMLDACLASGSKMLWLCNPHNPIGRTWSREELGKIAELCLKHRVLILSDDVYCGLIFPGRAYTPIASLSREISYRTVTLYSTSKSYNTTALRHSFIVAENPEISKMYQEALERADLNYGLNIMSSSFPGSPWNTA